ncbi:MAG: MFS transporter [Gammaproteobacteria bacterium]|nr:MFS transporter [Gammaproteobacteria bacterium]
MRNVWILTLAQGFAACGTITLVTFGGIVGTELAPQPMLATLPLSMSVLGIATMSLPAALLMQRIGRKPAFIASALVAAVAALLCALAITQRSFPLFCLAGLLIGSNMAFVQQYRFAAIEYVDAALAGKAVSTVMIGTLAAAFIAPTLGGAAASLGGWPQYTGSFVLLCGLCLLAALVLTRLPAAAPAATARAEAAGEPRPIAALLRDPRYRLAVLAGLASYAVMSFIMTATPLSMHVHDGFSTGETTTVITAHLLGMYLPSLATPWIVARLGVRGMMYSGLLINVVCVVICAFVGHQFLHYFAALLLLGIGWNLLFVGATTLLSSTYAPAERFRAQGFNDFAVFGSQALASLSAGVAIETLGWQVLNLVTLPLLLLVAWSLHKVDVGVGPRS